MDLKLKWVTLLEIACDPTSGFVSGMTLTSEQCAEILSIIKPPIPTAVPDGRGYWVGQEVTVIKKLHGHGFNIGDRIKLTAVGNNYLAADATQKYNWGLSYDEIEP